MIKRSLILFLFLIAGTVYAQNSMDQNDMPGPGRQREQGGLGAGNRNPMLQACREDVKDFCSDVQPGGGRIVECLKNHDKDISQECSDALSKARPQSLKDSSDQNDMKTRRQGPEQEDGPGSQGQPDDQGDQEK